MDVVVSFATTILNKLVDEAILQASYPFCFNKYVKELETEKTNMKSKIQEVVDRAKDAKKKTHKVVSEVEEWLSKADFLMAQVVELQEKSNKRNKMSCLKRCPNLISRYSLAKQLEEKTNEIKTHIQVEFSEFSRLASLPGMKYLSSQDFVDFESRKEVYLGILEALKDDKIHMIGLHGMPGSGKTTLVKEVGKEAEKFFDKVVFVVVSKTYDVRKIQNSIAGQLSLKFEEEEIQERAQRLFMGLTTGERLLIILDDVWEKLNFVDIGIANANNQMGCNILTTTRILDVCEWMGCQKIIQLEGLNEYESWALFQKHAGLFEDYSDTLKDLAKKITKICGGLPIAIAAVASALKDKSHDEWSEALKTLRDSSLIDIEEGLQSTYACLRLSYENLENEVAKSIFLFCSFYPEDHSIRVEQLIIIGLGLGLVGENLSYQARTQAIRKLIKKLIDSCLLLKDGEEGFCIKMHDLVRDVAIWMAKKENKLIMGQLDEDMIMKGNTPRYLWFDEVNDCPNNLNFPELELFYELFYAFIYSKPSVLTIQDDFLNSKTKLRVLVLEQAPYRTDRTLQFPISLHLINNLCCLLLYSWELGDISFIGSLKRLESLTVRDCSFDELPKCMTQQKKLRLLDLRSCKIQRSPFEVMGECSQLEVLYFSDNRGKDWKNRKGNSAEFFDKISTTILELKSYCIHFGGLDEDFRDHESYRHYNSFDERSLYIEDFEGCISIGRSKDMMRRAKTLSLRGIPKSWKNIIPDLHQTIEEGMNELTRLALHDSDGIECIIGQANNPNQVRIISNLTCLTLSKVKHLKSLCSGLPTQGLFANLEHLCIKGCDSLEHILTEDVKEIVDESDHRSYKNAFPNLKSLETSKCRRVEYLIPISFAKSLARLETLTLLGNDEMRSVFGQSLYEEDMNLNKHEIIEFFALKCLKLEDLPNIISICPENYHPIWPTLKELELDGCPQLNIKSINPWIACGGLRQEDDQMTSKDLLKVLQNVTLGNIEVEVVFDVEQIHMNGQQIHSSLRNLNFVNLPRLRHIWMGPENSALLQNLDYLNLRSCGNLKQVFPSAILKSLPQLRDLYITDCNELEEIIEEEDDQNVPNSRELVFPKLVSIIIKGCHKLKCVFPKTSACRVIPNLRVLGIQDASILEKIFGHEQHDVTTLKYVLLWNLPLLTSVRPSIALETVEYIVVDQCPKLSLTSSVTRQKMLNRLMASGHVRASGLLGGRKHIFQSFVFKKKKKSEDQSVHEQEMLEEKNVEGRVKECTASENVQLVTSLAHSESSSSTKSVRDLEGQSARKENISREDNVKGSFEGSQSYENAEIIIPSADSKLVSSPPGILVTSSTNTVTNIQTQIKFNSRKSDVEDLKDDYGGKSPTLSVPRVTTAKDELVTRAIADLEDLLKMPLKDIATSEDNSFRLLIAINFLSRLSLEDGALPHGVMAIIKSMHKDLPNILSSFKQAFASANKFVVLTQHEEVANAPVSKMSETQNSLAEAQEKEARLQQQIYRLEKEITNCEAELLSLEEKKRKYIAETVEFKKELDIVRKEKSKMVEDQRNARQQVFQIDHKWSVICSQFELAIAKENLS